VFIVSAETNEHLHSQEFGTIIDEKVNALLNSKPEEVQYFVIKKTYLSSDFALIGQTSITLSVFFNV